MTPAAAIRAMKFAYADPPYLGLAEKFYGRLHPEAAAFDDPSTHQALIERLCDEYSDGWAMSLHSPSLREILPMCPKEARVAAWVKPFCSFKPGVGVAYAWEPVIFMGGRRRTRQQRTVRDWIDVNITLRKGFTGAKPPAFVWWVLDVLNAERVDAVDDLFPGSGAVQDALDAWFQKPCNIGLFAGAA